MKILLADPHPEVSSALHRFVDLIPGVTQVCETGSLEGLLAACAVACPDLILLDLDLAGPDPARVWLIGELKSVCPRASVVVMSSQLEGQQEAQAAGASGFISKTDPPDAVFTGIARFLKGHPEDGG